MISNTMDFKKTELETPPNGYNVFVNYRNHQRDFWTRGYLMDDEWVVMTWGGTSTVPKDEITEWLPLSGITYPL